MGLFRDRESVRRRLHSVEEIGDAGGDVVVDQAHAFYAVDLTRTVANDSVRRSPTGLLPPWAFSQCCEDHRLCLPMRFDFMLKQGLELPCSALKEMVCR
jgi:hypothetical protein